MEQVKTHVSNTHRLLVHLHLCQALPHQMPLLVENPPKVVPVPLLLHDRLHVDQHHAVTLPVAGGQRHHPAVGAAAHDDLYVVREFGDFGFPLVDQVGGRHDERVALVRGARGGEDEPDARRLRGNGDTRHAAS